MISVFYVLHSMATQGGVGGGGAAGAGGFGNRVLPGGQVKPGGFAAAAGGAFDTAKPAGGFDRFSAAASAGGFGVGASKKAAYKAKVEDEAAKAKAVVVSTDFGGFGKLAVPVSALGKAVNAPKSSSTHNMTARSPSRASPSSPAQPA